MKMTKKLRIKVEDFLGTKKAKKPEVVFGFLFAIFLGDIKYWSEDGLINLVTGLFDLTEETFDFQVGALYGRKKKRFEKIILRRDRNEILTFIFDNLLSLEKLSLLPGFGFISKHGDRLWGNPEKHSIYGIRRE